MVDERTAYWGARDAARYRTRDDDPTGGDFVVAETLDANGDPVDVLLRWDDTAGEWVSGGPVNMDGSDVTNVGALDANSVSTQDLSLSGTIDGQTLIYADVIAGRGGSWHATQATPDVGTSSTVILDWSDIDFSRGIMKMLISGEDIQNSERFYEVIDLGAGEGFLEVLRTYTSGPVSSRSYTRNPNSVELAMSSGTADVAANARVVTFPDQL